MKLKLRRESGIAVKMPQMQTFDSIKTTRGRSFLYDIQLVSPRRDAGRSVGAASNYGRECEARASRSRPLQCSCRDDDFTEQGRCRCLIEGIDPTLNIVKFTTYNTKKTHDTRQPRIMMPKITRSIHEVENGQRTPIQGYKSAFLGRAH